MKFVSTSKSVVLRAVMAHMFLERAVVEKRLNEVSNMADVLDALNPNKVIDGFLEEVKINH